MSTPHNSAEKGDFGKTVLMPGDPLRAQFIAEHFLENAQLVNNVRGIHGYTGTQKDVKVSVMASGMGMPSIGIYSYELFNFYDVDNIIRIGSAGSMNLDVKLYDIVIGMGACTNSNYMRQYNLPGPFAPIADYTLLSEAIKAGEALGVNYHVGNVVSSDTFYDADPTVNDKWASMGIMAVEMEAAALYMNAIKAGKRALAILTISDSIVTGEATTAEERQNSFTQMMKVALDTAVAMENK